MYYQGLSGVIFLGGGTYTSVYMYVCTHVHACGAVQACVFNDIKNHTHACSMLIRFSIRIMMKTVAMAKYSDVMKGGYVCGMMNDNE